jgi:hypothetical protein
VAKLAIPFNKPCTDFLALPGFRNMVRKDTRCAGCTLPDTEELAGNMREIFAYSM